MFVILNATDDPWSGVKSLGNEDAALLLMFELGEIPHVYVSKYAYYLENMTGPVYNHFNRYDLGGRYNSLQSLPLINVLKFLKHEKLMTTVNRARPGKSPIKLWKLTDSGVLYVKGQIITRLDTDEYRRFGNLMRELKRIPKKEFVQIVEAHYRYRINNSLQGDRRQSLDYFMSGNEPLADGGLGKKWMGIHRKPLGVALVVGSAVGVAMLIGGSFLSISPQQSFEVDVPSAIAAFVGILAYLRR